MQVANRRKLNSADRAEAAENARQSGGEQRISHNASYPVVTAIEFWFVSPLSERLSALVNREMED
jgi:hypothetical protein